MQIVKDKAEFDEILKENPSVFVDFFATWCGPCKMLAPVVESLSEKNEDVTFVKVDVDECSDIAQEFGIMSIPTLIVFKNGEMVDKTIGFQQEEELQKVIDKAK